MAHFGPLRKGRHCPHFAKVQSCNCKSCAICLFSNFFRQLKSIGIDNVQKILQNFDGWKMTRFRKRKYRNNINEGIWGCCTLEGSTWLTHNWANHCLLFYARRCTHIGIGVVKCDKLPLGLQPVGLLPRSSTYEILLASNVHKSSVSRRQTFARRVDLWVNHACSCRGWSSPL